MSQFIRVSHDTLIPLDSITSIQFRSSMTLKELDAFHEGIKKDLSIEETVKRYLPSSYCLKHIREDGEIVLTIEHNVYRNRSIKHVLTDYHGLFVIETDKYEYVLSYADVKYYDLQELILKPFGLM